MKSCPLSVTAKGTSWLAKYEPPSSSYGGLPQEQQAVHVLLTILENRESLHGLRAALEEEMERER